MPLVFGLFESTHRCVSNFLRTLFERKPTTSFKSACQQSISSEISKALGTIRVCQKCHFAADVSALIL